jgi:hypothetical protein
VAELLYWKSRPKLTLKIIVEYKNQITQKFEKKYIYIHSSYSVSQFVIQKRKDQDIQNYKFSWYSVWVRNLVANSEGAMQVEGFRKNKKVLRRIFGSNRDKETGA